MTDQPAKSVRHLPIISRFEETVIVGNPEMRGQTRPEVVELQNVYHTEQARQLVEIIRDYGLNPDEVGYWGEEFQKNLCPSTGLESEGGFLYNSRTGAAISIVLDWVCEWGCGLPEWQGRYQPSLEKCKPHYFFTHHTDKDMQKLA